MRRRSWEERCDERYDGKRKGEIVGIEETDSAMVGRQFWLLSKEG